MSSRHASPASRGVVYWFRKDLRLHDAPGLQQAIARAQRTGGWLLPVHVHDEAWHATTPWGFARTGPHRLAWQRMAVEGLSAQLNSLGSRLLCWRGEPVVSLHALLQALGQPELVCEDIAAPEEQAQIAQLQALGVVAHTVWQSTLIAPEALPCAPEAVPDTFTHFRQLLERHGVRASAPLPAPSALPPLPPADLLQAAKRALAGHAQALPTVAVRVDPRTAFPWQHAQYHGGEAAALAHLARYCARALPHSYKATRNELIGVDGSSKWSPWLATGALSARTAWSAIEAFERENGASPSSYWLFFELLWRDHFRWLHRKHGLRLYRARGLREAPVPEHKAEAFARWCQGETGDAFIDAGMRELAATGFLSNRMRQNVASHLIHELQGDWRAGAAWFEARLIDHDVYSNQGNWLYLSGRGTDPRPLRRFDSARQAQMYDPQGRYRALWA